MTIVHLCMIKLYVSDIIDLGLVKCYQTKECTNSIFGLMTAAECCIGNSDGVAYTKPRSEECHVCIGKSTYILDVTLITIIYHAVFGWFNDSYTGVEQDDHHLVTAGFQKGAQRVERNLTFTINEITGRFCWLGELNDTLSLYLFR